MAKRDRGALTGDPATYAIPNPAGGVQMETFIPWTLIKRGVKKQVITPIDAPEQFHEEATRERQVQRAERDSGLVKALGLAHYWQRLLDEGAYRSVTEIAIAEGMDLGQASRIVRLSQLAPDIIEACLAGAGAPDPAFLACRLEGTATSVVCTHGLTVRNPARSLSACFSSVRSSA